MTDLLEPWKPLDEKRKQWLEKELKRELPRDHVLAGKSVRGVAARMDRGSALARTV